MKLSSTFGRDYNNNSHYSPPDMGGLKRGSSGDVSNPPPEEEEPAPEETAPAPEETDPAPSTGDSVGTSGSYNLSGTWKNFSMPAQTGKFEARFTYSSNNASINTDIAFSDKVQTSWDFLASVRAKNRVISANGVGSLAFKAGVTYSFRLVFDVAARTYSAYVREGSGSEKLIGSGIKFKRAVSRIDNITLYGHGAFKISDIVIKPL